MASRLSNSVPRQKIQSVKSVKSVVKDWLLALCLRALRFLGFLFQFFGLGFDMVPGALKHMICVHLRNLRSKPFPAIGNRQSAIGNRQFDSPIGG
jgi:hypothetical protein